MPWSRLKSLIGASGAARSEAGGWASVPPGVRVYAIGDVHGQLKALETLLGKIDRDLGDAQVERVELVFLGDYIDRGLQSADVIDLLCEPVLPRHHPHTVFLRGNHEDAMLTFLRDAEFGARWLDYGGLETLVGYGVESVKAPRSSIDWDRVQRDLEAVLPPAHRRFLEATRMSYRAGDYFFAHAGVNPDVALDRQEAEDLLWIREPFLNARKDFGAVVVHGHTPEEKPQVRENRIGIDTGAYQTGILTALALEGDQRWFLQN